MKKFLVLLFILIALPVFAQVLPPDYGWSKIYQDTLGVGYRSIWSFNYNAVLDIAGGGTLKAKYQDTTIVIANDNVWGAASIWVQIDSVAGYDDAALAFLISYYNNDIGTSTSIASYAPTIASTTWKFESVGGTSVVNSPGSQILNLSSVTPWTINQGFILKMTTTDTMLVTLWLLKQ
jgi:hypothetical protein